MDPDQTAHLGFLVFTSMISALSNTADIKSRQHFQDKSLVAEHWFRNTSNSICPYIEKENDQM